MTPLTTSPNISKSSWVKETMNGIINVYKEQGFTSHDVVAKLRGILHFKKIGHTGTLDPDAVGVLPVCVGKGTKVCDLLTDKDKTYAAVVKLGVTTDTLDMTGMIQTENPVSVTEEQIRQVLSHFQGEISQIPPMYSAIKINGKKLYELARQGKEIERKPRTVVIHKLSLEELCLEKDEFAIEVTCSKGTYIRSLCHDIGQELGCGAAMKSLVRTRVGNFRLEDALTLEQIEKRKENPETFLRPVDSLFDSYPACFVSPYAMKFLQNGNIVSAKFCESEGGHTPADGEMIRMYSDSGEFFAIYRFEKKDNQYRIVKMFH